MQLFDFIETIQLDETTQDFLILLAFRVGLLFLFILASWISGRLLPSLVKVMLTRSLAQKKTSIVENFLNPLQQPLVTTITLILVSVSLNIIQVYSRVYQVLNFVMDIAVTLAVTWLATRFARQLIRIYGIELVKRFSQEVNDVILIFETVANIIIVFFAITIFSQSHNFNLVALLTGVGIAGGAVAFAAQEALGQIIGTIVIYLDRPFVPGEYIRVNFNIQAEDVYGRVESIGIRSTKIRVAVNNTLVIVPNSVMASKDIENISRGTKVMALLLLDFTKYLSESEEALVSQTLEKAVDGIFGIDPGSTRITLFQPEDQQGTRARVSFFVMGSSDSSINLRKRMLEVANESIARELNTHGLEFTVPDPTVYVDSPVTL